jgi:DNA polymerase-3 subunit beta
MKFSTSSSDLLQKLTLSNKTIGSNTVLHDLKDFLFTVKGNQLTIAANNLDTATTTSMDVSSEGDGTISVPAKILLDTLRTLPQQPVIFNIDMENFGIEISSPSGKYHIVGENGADFPKSPEADSVDSDSPLLTPLIINNYGGATVDPVPS